MNPQIRQRDFYGFIPEDEDLHDEEFDMISLCQQSREHCSTLYGFIADIKFVQRAQDSQSVLVLKRDSLEHRFSILSP